jgi:hypothetical protein
MPSGDLSDLHGAIPRPLRWGAEVGVLGVGKFDPETGERTVEEIELGSSMAKFVMDLATRQRGYGLIRVGLCDMRLTAVGTPPPLWPNDDDYKSAIGCWLWNPPLGEVRLETNASLFRQAVSNTWDHCRAFKEAAEGLVPVVHFVDRREVLIRQIGKMFWQPVIRVISWVPRDKVPPFALREPTVKPPAALDSQVRHALLEHLQREEPSKGKGKAPLKRGAHNEYLDDKLPDDPIPDLA